jgi:DNA-binding MarR family transcriptional regulator
MQLTLNLSRFHTSPASELGPLLEAVASESDDGAVDAMLAVLRNRALRLIRSGSSSDLSAEAAVLNRYLFSRAGRALQSRDASRHTRIRMIAEMVGEAGQRTDSVFLSAVLSSHTKYARPIVEMLSRAGSEGLPRKQLLQKLNVEESHLSHILADLQDADVIVKYRRPGKKEVRVGLGPAGREIVGTTLLPEWFSCTLKIFRDAADGTQPRDSQIVQTLEKSGVPSKMIADHVVQFASELARGATGNREARVGLPVDRE